MRAGPVAAATPGVQGDGDGDGYSYVRLFSIPKRGRGIQYRKEEEEGSFTVV
jgi:hypothetical protein